MSDSEGSGFSDVDGDQSAPEDQLEGDFESDADDDYDSDEEDDTKHKRQRTGAAKFIIHEADVDNDDRGEDEEPEWEAGAEDYIDKNFIEDDSERHGAQRLHQLFNQENEENLEEYYKNRYQTNFSGQYVDEDDIPDHIKQQGLLPGVKDPNLWMVKCRIGEEKATAIQMMRKYMAYQYKDEPLQIKSVVCVEGIKGYLYVESFKQTHVKHAIQGVGNLRMGYYKQQMVPVKEMTDVLRVVKEKVVLKERAWVRMKRGVYKDDLAQVDYVDLAQNQVTIKLIPRIDYSRPRGISRTSGDAADKRKKRRRPISKLFDLEAIRGIGGEVSTDGDYYMFEGNRYSRKGFLHKTFVMSAIMTEGVKPTLSELEKFEDKPENIDMELVNTKSTSDVTHSFAAGDNVEVIEGELIHLQGKIQSVEGNTIFVMPKHEDLKDLLEFPAHELCKHFKIGDHVKVVAGRYEGDTGLIVRVEENMAILFSDLTMHELKVLPRDLQLCNEMSSGVDSMGQFQLGDLVQLDAHTVGVIVRLEREGLQILSMHNKVSHVKPQGVTRKKESRSAIALDAEQNNIQLKDIVKVIDGPHSGRQGEIRHIYRSFAFLHSRLMTENGGIFVCRNRHIVLAGGSRPMDSSLITSGYSPMSPRISSPAHGSGPQQQAGGRGRGRVGRDRDMIGQTVRICQGPFKGYIGIVKDATETTARVELHSMFKTITVDRNRLNPVGGQKRSGASTYYARTPMYGSQTPMYGSGSRTPMYGSQTPVHDGSRTPHYDSSQTPLHDGSQTPGRSGAWDPNNPNTPSRQSDYDYGFDDATPSPQAYSSNPATPGYASDTPPNSGPYTPATPGSASGIYGSESTYSPYQPTASPGSYQPSPAGSFNQAPSPGTYQGTPSPQSYHLTSPGSYQATPSPVGFPMTPGAPSPMGFNPHTPGGTIDPNQSEWQTTDIEVKIRDTHDDKQLIFKTGVIRSVSGAMCSVFLPEDDKIVNIHAHHLEPVVPTKTDRVKVILGDDRESTGMLINIDGEDGIVKMDQADLKILQLRFLGKLHEK
ncbi:transcription elongation factor SPT5-like isoform X2 [Anneissia japonica]|uniref:transcription elongation factor SPT5-like isoform X1 n=1 Tax=Anneissia japonica TaxID=1529436 RepID=UPI00142552BC|nr:transcription elongation factor SPT5-like isoform X1 [Anneissia japonica]XP_033102672.1 transcription elongation factor SPT5-like isoform X2 [Anneissia japonica]